MKFAKFIHAVGKDLCGHSLSNFQNLLIDFWLESMDQYIRFANNKIDDGFRISKLTDVEI